MYTTIKTAIDEFICNQLRQPKYVCLGKLQIQELCNDIKEMTGKSMTPIEAHFGKIYGINILPIDRDTFFEVV